MTGARKLENIITEVKFRNKELEDFDETIVWKSEIDKIRTLQFLHVDPSMIKYVQEGLLTDKGAYISPLVAQVRFFFLAKNIAFQIML